MLWMYFVYYLGNAPVNLGMTIKKIKKPVLHGVARVAELTCMSRC